MIVNADPYKLERALVFAQSVLLRGKKTQTYEPVALVAGDNKLSLWASARGSCVCAHMKASVTERGAASASLGSLLEVIWQCRDWSKPATIQYSPQSGVFSVTDNRGLLAILNAALPVSPNLEQQLGKPVFSVPTNILSSALARLSLFAGEDADSLVQMEVVNRKLVFVATDTMRIGIASVRLPNIQHSLAYKAVFRGSAALSLILAAHSLPCGSDLEAEVRDDGMNTELRFGSGFISLRKAPEKFVVDWGEYTSGIYEPLVSVRNDRLYSLLDSIKHARGQEDVDFVHILQRDGKVFLEYNNPIGKALRLYRAPIGRSANTDTFAREFLFNHIQDAISTFGIHKKIRFSINLASGVVEIRPVPGGANRQYTERFFIPSWASNRYSNT